MFLMTISIHFVKKKKDIKKKKYPLSIEFPNFNMAVITNQCDNVGRPVTHPQREEQGPQ